jgi:signal transduction histidine kinase
MRAGTRRLIHLLAVVGLAAAIPGPGSAQARPAEATTKRILLLQQYAGGSPGSTRFDEAFVQAMRSFPGELYLEVIGGSGFPGAEPRRLTLGFLAGKYAGRPIDVVVAVGIEPLMFAREYGDIFGFPQIVAVAQPAGYLDRGGDVTGLRTGEGIRGTIDLGLGMRAGTEQVYVIDGAPRGIGAREEEFRSQLADRPELEVIYLRELPLAEILSRVAALPDHAIVYLLRQSMLEVDGINQYQAVAQITTASRVPVFSPLEDYVGHGVVGGYVWRPEADARRVAEIAKRVVAGERARDIPVRSATNENVVDWRQLERWSIPAASLPAGSVVLFRTVSFFQRYRFYVVGGAVVVVLQAALTVGLLVQRRQRRLAEAEMLSGRRVLDVVQARNAAMLRAIPDLMFVLLRDGTYVDYHARDPRDLFAPPEGFLGRRVREVMPPPLGRVIMQAIEEALAATTDDPVVVEYELPLHEQQRHFEARLVRVGEDRVMSIIRDVTEAKRALALNQELAGRLITAQENERARIARDLHDGVAQEVASVTIDLGYIKQKGQGVHSQEVKDVLVAVERRAASVAGTLRLLSRDLHPGVLQHVGLTAAIRAHCTEYSRRHQVEISLSAEGDCKPPHRTTALSLFRIVQEALRNAAEHGRAREVAISLSRSDGRLTLTVSDDGAGFDVVAARARGGLGLVSIEERARMAKGSVSIRSEPGRGTRIEATVPFDLEAIVHAPRPRIQGPEDGSAARTPHHRVGEEDLVAALGAVPPDAPRTGTE